MGKPFLFLCVVALLPACVSYSVMEKNDSAALSMQSMQEQWESGIFIKDSYDGEIVVIGVSSRLVRRADEILAAKNDAARKIAMFYGISGTVESFHRAGAGFFDFIAKSRINLEPAIADYTRFIERLTFNPEYDVIEFPGGTLIRFTYSAEVARLNFTNTLDTNGRPAWIDNRNLPSVDAYMVAVGFSQNQVWLRDTVIRSTQAAAAALLKMTGTLTETETVVLNGQAVTYIHSRSEGRFRNFRIIGLWIDPENMSVYTLGIARL